MALKRRLPKLGGGCCCSPSGAGCLSCSPCQIPEKTLTYAYTGVAPLSPTSGSGSLTFDGTSAWASASFAGGYTIAVHCVSGIVQIKIILGGVDKAVITTAASYVCNPLSLDYDVPISSAAYTAGFRTVTISDPGPTTFCTESSCLVTFHVEDCATFGTGGVPGLGVNTKCGSTTIDAGTTDASGNVTLSVAGCFPATVNIPTVGPRYDPVSIPVSATCGHIQNIVLPPSAGYTCAPCASHTNPPVSATTLNLTDPDYGGVVLTSTDGITYTGTKTVSWSCNSDCDCAVLAAEFGCADGSIAITYTFNDPSSACALKIAFDAREICPFAAGGGLASFGMAVSNPPYLATSDPVPSCLSGVLIYLLWTVGGVFTITE